MLACIIAQLHFFFAKRSCEWIKQIHIRPRKKMFGCTPLVKKKIGSVGQIFVVVVAYSLVEAKRESKLKTVFKVVTGTCVSINILC